MAHTLTEAQSLFDHFRTAASLFGLTVSLAKAGVILQAVNKLNSNQTVITAGETVLTAVDKFCYFSSILAADATKAKASVAFGRLSKRIWNEHGIMAAYKAVILTVLLYGSESWTIYRRQIAKL